jgi:hypothetical protein
MNEIMRIRPLQAGHINGSAIVQFFLPEIPKKAFGILLDKIGFIRYIYIANERLSYQCILQ